MSFSQEPQCYHVKWYIAIEGVREDVSMEIADGKLQRIVAGRRPNAVELGDVALIPGLVNAHTHLEFSQMSKPISPSVRFTDWIRDVVNYRRSHSDSVPAAIQQGIEEAIRGGATLIGDIATTGWSIHDYSTSGFRGVVFQELLGLTEGRVAAQCELARQTASSSRTSFADDSLRMGLSPHAPYSVHPGLLRKAVEASKESSMPLALHLAESRQELELLSDATGEFRELLTDFGIWRDGLFGGLRPIDYLKAVAECPRVLIIHGNFLDEAELRYIANHPNMTLIYCPRTHAAFGHEPHPWRRLLQLEGNVAIGTDSRASNPDLSVFAELQFLADREPDVSHLELLKLGSQAGRASLIGRSTDDNADFCAVHWDPKVPVDPERKLFAKGNRIVGTMVAGKWVERSGDVWNG